jgi:hypothetical protein
MRFPAADVPRLLTTARPKYPVRLARLISSDCGVVRAACMSVFRQRDTDRDIAIDLRDSDGELAIKEGGHAIQDSRVSEPTGVIRSFEGASWAYSVHQAVCSHQKSTT